MSMTINDKIKQILIDKNLTPSYFADEIGVQRSSISHILSGRNRPSFDIIQKIIRRFPELGYEWIMEEDNQSGSTNGQTNYANRLTTTRPNVDRYAQPLSVPYTTPSTSIRSQRNEIPPANAGSPVTSEQALMTSSSELTTAANEKKVERILIFYTDGSFREYTPTL